LLAIRRNDVEGVKQLLKLEADGCNSLLNVPENKTGFSPLMIAAHSGAS